MCKCESIGDGLSDKIGLCKIYFCVILFHTEEIKEKVFQIQLAHSYGSVCQPQVQLNLLHILNFNCHTINYNLICLFVYVTHDFIV